MVILLLLAIILVIMPAMLVGVPVRPGNPFTDYIYHIELGPWGHSIWTYVDRLAHGTLIPKAANRAQELFWNGVAQNLLPQFLVTLKLVSTAFHIGVGLGVTVGWLLSRLAPRWARRAAFGLTTLLNRLPDLLIATALDLGLILTFRAMGVFITAADVRFYKSYIAPALALSVRTAVAKGLPGSQVVLKHMGKNVLVRIWTALPVVTGIHDGPGLFPSGARWLDPGRRPGRLSCDSGMGFHDGAAALHHCR
jgi:ABC-type dipeptide/oligopeptide/nickel transport system permease component